MHNHWQQISDNGWYPYYIVFLKFILKKQTAKLKKNGQSKKKNFSKRNTVHLKLQKKCSTALKIKKDLYEN